MKYSEMTGSSLAKVIGDRIKRHRLNENVALEDIAEIVGISRQTLSKAENGKGSLETVMSILIALDMTDHLDAFLPPPPISPIQLAKMQGKERLKASKPRSNSAKNNNSDEDEMEW